METKLTFIGRNPKNISKWSSKFWFIKQQGNQVQIRFGKIGSQGTLKTKEFPSSFSAIIFASARIAEQRVKGYTKA